MSVKISDCRAYEGNIRNVGVSTESSSTNVRLSIETFNEQIKLIVVEK